MKVADSAGVGIHVILLRIAWNPQTGRSPLDYNCDVLCPQYRFAEVIVVYLVI
jgi:hypothetical protein